MLTDFTKALMERLPVGFDKAYDPWVRNSDRMGIKFDTIKIEGDSDLSANFYYRGNHVVMTPIDVENPLQPMLLHIILTGMEGVIPYER
jgi:hypothetical protein